MFVPGVRDAATIGALVTGIGGPINVLAVDGSPSIPELEALGVARVSLGSGPMRATMAVLRDIAHELEAHWHLQVVYEAHHDLQRGQRADEMTIDQPARTASHSPVPSATPTATIDQDARA